MDDPWSTPEVVAARKATISILEFEEYVPCSASYIPPGAAKVPLSQQQSSGAAVSASSLPQMNRPQSTSCDDDFDDDGWSDDDEEIPVSPIPH